MNIKINVFSWLIFSFIWSYGYMGMLTSVDKEFFGIISIFLCVIIILLFFINNKYFETKNYIWMYSINKKNVILFLSILVMTFIVVLINNNPSLHGDEIYHSYASQYHTIFFVAKLEKLLPNFTFKNIAWIISILSLLFILMVIYFINKIRFKYKYVILSLFVLVFFRVGLISIGGFDPAHPPFRLFPLWLSSSIFSLSDFAFRIPGIVALSLMGCCIHNVLCTKKGLSPLITWSSVLSVISIPVLWNTSHIVEPSIWSALFATYVLVIILDGRFSHINLFLLVALFSITLLMRQSIIFIFPLLVYLIIYQIHTNSTLTLKWFFIYLSPVLIAVPLIFRSAILGSPAQAIIESESQLGAFGNILFALSSGRVWDISFSNLEPWIIFVFLAFVPPKQNRLKYILAIFLYLISAIIVFYSIRPVLWGIPRYQAEFLVPLVIVGFIRFLSFKLNNIAKIITVSLLLVYNIVTNIVTFDDTKIPQNGHKTITSHPVYEYGPVMREAKENGYAGKMLIMNVQYGPMYEILNGYTIQEVNSNMKIIKQHNVWPGRMNLYEIVNDHQIGLVLVTDDFGYLSDTKVGNYLIEAGFSYWKNFGGGSDKLITGFIRSN